MPSLDRRRRDARSQRRSSEDPESAPAAGLIHPKSLANLRSCSFTRSRRESGVLARGDFNTPTTVSHVRRANETELSYTARLLLLDPPSNPVCADLHRQMAESADSLWNNPVLIVIAPESAVVRVVLALKATTWRVPGQTNVERRPVLAFPAINQVSFYRLYSRSRRASLFFLMMFACSE